VLYLAKRQNFGGGKFCLFVRRCHVEWLGDAAVHEFLGVVGSRRTSPWLFYIHISYSTYGEDAHGRRPGAGGLRPWPSHPLEAFLGFYFKGTLEVGSDFNGNAAPVSAALRFCDQIVGLNICEC